MIIVHLFTFSCFAQEKYKEITLQDIWTKRIFSPVSVHSFKSMNDGIHYTVLEKRSKIVKYSYETGISSDTSGILNTNQINSVNISAISEYEFSNDETKILLTADIEPIYRHSFKASYYIRDCKTKKITPLSENGKQQLATFSPDGKKIAFVRDNNLFIKDLITYKELQITNDGKYNEIINGAPDWVYEEEFSFSKAFAWSPDGEKIAYYKFDETRVKQFNMTVYGSLYPDWYKFKYPKAGEDNAVVNIHIYNLKSNTSIIIDTGNEKDQYIPRIKWTKDANILTILRLNRLQNKLEILFADATTGNSQVILTEENKYYIDIDDDLTYLNDKKHFIFTSEKDGYNHIYLYDMNGNLIRQITNGKWDVTKFIGYNNEDSVLYYISAEYSPLQRDVYSINIQGTDKKKLSSRQGTNNATFSNGYKYFINEHTDANTPVYITLHDSKGKLIRVLEENTELKETIKDYGFSKKEFFKFTTSENVVLNAWMIKPLDFDENKKYPVFIYVYGGPGSQTVTDAWDRNIAWHQLLAQKGYIIVSVDNRGTGGRGEEFKKCTYLQLGKFETIDLIEAAKYLASLHYVDASRIGIQGWSYGGYLSTLCITKGADFFKAAVAVAPVTNWRYYDTIYTERFLRTPQENPDGYDDNSPINFVEKLKGKYLLIHGTADDNVHFQNTMELVKKLVDANKAFNMQFYPDKNHGIYGGNTRLHLFTKITDFILENL